LLSAEDPDEFANGALHYEPEQGCYLLREGSPGLFQRIMNWFS